MKRSRSDAHLTVDVLPMDATLTRLVMCQLDLHDLAPLWRCNKFLSTFATNEDLCMTYLSLHPDLPWHIYFASIYNMSPTCDDVLRFLHNRTPSHASCSFALWYYYANKEHISSRMLLAWYGMTERLVKSVHIPAEKFYKSIVCQTAVAAGQAETLQALLDAGQGRFVGAMKTLTLVAIRHHSHQCLGIVLSHPNVTGKVANDDIVMWAVAYKNRTVLDMAPNLLCDNGGHEKGYQMSPGDIPPSKGCAECLLFDRICVNCVTLPEIMWLAERQWVDLQQLAQYVTTR